MAVRDCLVVPTGHRCQLWLTSPQFQTGSIAGRIIALVPALPQLVSLLREPESTSMSARVIVSITNLPGLPQDRSSSTRQTALVFLLPLLLFLPQLLRQP